MTNVQRRLAAVLAAMALVIGCGLVMAMTPQKAHADLAPGSTFQTAMNLSIANKNLKATYDGSINSNSAKKKFKFTTSTRRSSYKVTVKSDNDVNLTVDFYNSSFDSLGSEYSFETDDRSSRTFESLDLSSTYYISISRPTSANSNDRADYTVTVKEIVTPPAAPRKAYCISKAKKKITVKYKKPKYANGYQIAYKKGNGKWVKAKTTKRSYTIKNLKKNKEYTVKVRAYRTVYGKKHYGEWTDEMTLKPNGKKKKEYA